MRSVVILGGGTAGTLAANKLRRRLPKDEWSIRVVDKDDAHVYQPGLLLLPFNGYRPEQLVRPRGRFLPRGVELVIGDVELVKQSDNVVLLRDGRTLEYDYLLVATGTSPRPDQTPGMLSGEWRRSVFDFYTMDGATALREKLASWDGGRLVVHVTEMPIKCPVAPLEFVLLADAFFQQRGVRGEVDISFVTPLDGAFTRPTASRRLGGLLHDRRISLEPDFVIDHVDAENKRLVSMDERAVPFDLLVTVPLNMGPDYLAASGLGDELNYLPVDKATLRSREHDNVFALGDATDIPASKAGSVAHFSAHVVVENMLAQINGEPLARAFDGHANCFIESGHGKGLLLDFDYETEPLPGKYPLPLVGPFTLLGESRTNHFGKLAFRWAYWYLLLQGRPLPVPKHVRRLTSPERS